MTEPEDTDSTETPTPSTLSIPSTAMNLKQRCIISSPPVSYVSEDDDSPSPYCKCIMDGFENPGDDELIFSNFNIPEKTECGNPSLIRMSGGKKLSLCTEGQIPDISNLMTGLTSTTPDPNVSDTYLQSMTNLYNTKLNEDSEILASYIRCKEESYKPIINSFRSNATVITDFVTQNQDSIESILKSGKIESTLDKINEFPLESITPTISQVDEYKNRIIEIQQYVNDIKTKLDSPLLMIAIYIIAIILLINLAFRIWDTLVRLKNHFFP